MSPRVGRRAVSCAHLLGTPWEQADCAAIARAALELCGLDVPAYGFARFGAGDAAALRTYLDATSELWVRVGSTADEARELGDIIVSRLPDGGQHLSVVVDAAARRAITTTADTGAVIVESGSIRAVEQVIRWAT